MASTCTIPTSNQFSFIKIKLRSGKIGHFFFLYSVTSNYNLFLKLPENIFKPESHCSVQLWDENAINSKFSHNHQFTKFLFTMMVAGHYCSTIFVALCKWWIYIVLGLEPNSKGRIQECSLSQLWDQNAIQTWPTEGLKIWRGQTIIKEYLMEQNWF